MSNASSRVPAGRLMTGGHPYNDPISFRKSPSHAVLAPAAARATERKHVVKHPPLAFGLPPRTTHRLAPIAKIGVAKALAPLVLAIAVGSLGLDRESTIGMLTFPTLGVATLLGGVGAVLAGLVAMLGEHDRSVGTILATVAGALLGWFMIVELFIEG